MRESEKISNHIKDNTHSRHCVMYLIDETRIYDNVKASKIKLKKEDVIKLELDLNEYQSTISSGADSCTTASKLTFFVVMIGNSSSRLYLS